MHSAYKSQSQNTGRAFQYQFDLEIQKVRILKSIQIPASSYMEVIWRRGQNNITTKTKSQIKGSQQQVEFNEKLSMISTCYLNAGNQNKTYNPKQSIVSVIININGSQKLFGSLNINLSQVLNPNNHREPGVKLIQQELNGRTKSKVYLKLTSTYLKQMVKSDQQSIGSSNNYHNTSNYSIGFGNQNSDKKITDIPSKDAYSVVSYGGNAKYSYRKDDQPSTSSVIKRDDSNSKYDEKSITYGYYGTNGLGSGNSFYNKTLNQYNLTNRNTNALSAMNQTSTSVMRPSRNSQSEHNKSTLGQQNSKLLTQEQNKRSKLEAENTKSKVQNSELKSKLTEYVTENMKLKEQLKKAKGNSESESKLKQQKQELMNKNYTLAQQIRELKTKFDKFQMIQREYQNVKQNGQKYEKQADEQQAIIIKLNNEIKQLHAVLKQSKTNENAALRQLRQLQNNSYSMEGKFKRQVQEAHQNYKNQISKQQSKVYSLESELKDKNNEVKYLQQQCQKLEFTCNQNEENLRKMTQQYRSKQLQLRQLYEKYGSKIKQSNNYSTQMQSLKNEIKILQDQKSMSISEYEQKMCKQKQLSTQTKNKNQELTRKNNELMNQKNNLLNQIRKDSLNSRRQADKCRELESALNHHKAESQKELFKLKNEIEKIQKQNISLQRQNDDKNRIINDYGQNRTQSQELLKQNFQMQLELKYKSQKLANLQNIQMDLQNIAMQKEMIDRNYKQLQQAHEKLEKQLKQKNRAYILQIQKNKMLNEDKANTNKGYLQIKQELQNARDIIKNGDRQVKQMEQYIYQLECGNNQLQRELKKAEAQKANKDQLIKYQKQIEKLQQRLKQLENRNNEKLLTLQNLNKNLAMSKNQIKQLQIVSEERHQQIINRDKYIGELDNRFRQMEINRSNMQEDLMKQQQQKKSNIKKVQMLMQELFVYKKKFQQQKNRVHSSSYIRSSEDFMKIRNLQNQLQKRDDRISKMQKQIINLEDQNVKLNIQIMKKLEALKQSGITLKDD